MKNVATVVVGVVATVVLALVGSLSLTAQQRPIAVLVYETESSNVDSPSRRLLDQARLLSGVTATLFGAGSSFEGYGSKYAALYPLLLNMAPSQLVVVTDGRDVLLNMPALVSSSNLALTVGPAFRAAFDALTAATPGAIVISAEAQCCVSALTWVKPGDYFDATTGMRNQRACSSGEADCLWNGDDQSAPWEQFMRDVAQKRTATDSAQSYDDIYLNAGLMAGTAGDLVRLIERSNIGKDEDDQAVLTDFMYTYPDSIVLDYAQSLFGNNRGGLASEKEDVEGCIFSLNADNEQLVHATTRTSPLFVHSPGGYLQCHDDLTMQLGYMPIAVSTQRRLKSIFDGTSTFLSGFFKASDNVSLNHSNYRSLQNNYGQDNYGKKARRALQAVGTQNNYGRTDDQNNYGRPLLRRVLQNNYGRPFLRRVLQGQNNYGKGCNYGSHCARSLGLHSKQVN